MTFKTTPQKLLINLLLATTTTAYSMYTQANANRHNRQLPTNLDAVMQLYGWEQPQQRQALRFLIKEAGITKDDHIFDEVVQDEQELASKMLWLVSNTQQQFTKRTGSQERWEVKTSDWMQNPKSQAAILQALNTLDMLSEVTPKTHDPDAVCILGASKGVMQKRFDYADRLYQQKSFKPGKVLCLGGERYVSFNTNGISVDGTKEELQKLADELGKPLDKLTETDLMRQAFRDSHLFGKFSADDVVIFDTPRGDLPRPTTETTVKNLCAWLREHPEVKTVCFVSGQPHTRYQEDIIKAIIAEEDLDIKVEVVGSEYKNIVQTESGKINYLVQALGTRIWSSTPRIMHALGLDTSSTALQETIKEQYARSPLLYKSLASNQDKAKQTLKP